MGLSLVTSGWSVILSLHLVAVLGLSNIKGNSAKIFLEFIMFAECLCIDAWTITGISLLLYS